MYPHLFKKTYSANQSTQTLFDGELFLGIEKPLLFDLEGQLGLAVAATSNAKLSGDIWDDADPLFNNFNYTYNIQHTPLESPHFLSSKNRVPQKS